MSAKAMTPRVLIFGTGSIGGVYAYLLSRGIPESHIVVICRSNYDRVFADGITIQSTLWGNDLRVRPTVVRSVTEAAALSSDPFDYILVCSKALPTIPSTAEIIKPAVSPATTIVLIQNGELFIVHCVGPQSGCKPGNPSPKLPIITYVQEYMQIYTVLHS